jgi:hypothetical protein
MEHFFTFVHSTHLKLSSIKRLKSFDSYKKARDLNKVSIQVVMFNTHRDRTLGRDTSSNMPFYNKVKSVV